MAAKNQTGGTTPASSQYPMSSLYVGDLHPTVTESMLYNKFAAAGPVLSIRVCRDAITRRSLGYAYVNFQNPLDAERALDTMNFDVMNNKPIRIMWSQRDPTLRRSSNANIFIKNLNPHIDTKSIYDTFSMFGKILSCKIATNEEGNSKGYGFIHFETEEAAQKAIDKVNGMLLDDKQVYVGRFLPRSARLRDMGDAAHRYTNVYIKNFGDKLDDEKLRTLCEKFGTVTSSVVMKDSEGKSRGFGFCSFEKPEDAERAVTELNGYELPDSPDQKLAACRAQKKSERDAELARTFQQIKSERLQRYQGVNLYVKNLDEKIDTDELRRQFEPYGTISSAKVMVDEQNRSKGFGFVCFEKPDSATKAVIEMNSRMVNGKPLYVALAQRKEDRRAALASQYMQRMAMGRMQGTATAATGMQTLYPQINPGVYVQGGLPSQRPPFVSNAMPTQMRTGGNMTRWNGGFGSSGYGAMPGYMVQQPNQQYQNHRGGQRQQQPGGASRSQYPGPRPQQQSRPAGFGSQQPQQQQNRPGGLGPQQAKPPMQGQQTQAAYYPQMVGTQQQARSGLPPSQQVVQPPTSNEDLSAKLIAASPQEQKQIIGEQLYPRISQFCSGETVGKITGMMLEMPVSDLLELLDNPEQLKVRVNEASTVLETVKTEPVA